MAKQPSLEPKQTTKPHAPWVVNLPPLLSSTAKRERRYFDSKKAAKQFCVQQRIRLENYGTASTSLPAGKIEEAAAAFEKLDGTGIGLLAAVEQVLQWKHSRETSVTFKMMFESFIEAKRGKRSAAYLTALRCTLPRFGALYDRRQGGVYRYALRMTGSEATAEDVTQDVFCALMRDSEQYDPARGSVKAYLLRNGAAPNPEAIAAGKNDGLN